MGIQFERLNPEQQDQLRNVIEAETRHDYTLNNDSRTHDERIQRLDQWLDDWFHGALTT